MSLILEALRKSEAERRRGQVPDLHTEPSPAALRGRDGPPAWLWLALALATAAVLAMALWLARGALSGPPPALDVPIAATGVTAAMSMDSTGDAVLSSEPISTVGPAPIANVRAGSGPVLASMPLPGREHGAAPIAAAPSAAAALSTPAARAPETTRAAVAAIPAVSTTPPAIVPPEPVDAAIAALATMPAAVASTSEATTLAAATPGSAPLRLSDLAVAERRKLPLLKMSMHMWAPTQRFAIIDGTRVSEGDRIGDAVVEEITIDGVVLAWQGQRLQIPR